MSPRESISVVIPAYNRERYISQALASVLAQTLAAAEIIVIDDGSTDGTVAEVRRFDGVRLIKTVHGGVSAARNTGVEASTGTLLAFLDSDDTWEPTKLERQAQLLASNHHLDVAMCRHRYAFDGVVPAWFRGFPEGGAGGCLLVPSLIRRSAWDRVGPFDTGMSHGEDGDWYARAVDMQVRFGVVDEVLMTYRIHDANASAMAAGVTSGILTALRKSVRRKQAAGG